MFFHLQVSQRPLNRSLTSSTRSVIITHMTHEELQYQFETQEPRALIEIPTAQVVAFARHVLERIPPAQWNARHWATTTGIVDVYRRYQTISLKQKWFIVNTLSETVPENVAYL